MLAQSHFSHKELHKKNKSMMHDMLMLDKGVNWNDLDPLWKNGTLIYKQIPDNKFKKDVNCQFIEEDYFLDFVKDLIRGDQ